MKKICSFRLNEETKEKIKLIANHNNTSQGNAIELAINEYLKNKNVENKILKDSISVLLDEKLIEIKDSVNKDTKMLIEFWNHYYFVNEYETFATTDLIKTNALTEAETVINKRIGKLRQKKISGKI